MKSNKKIKTKKDILWQKRVEKHIEKENVKTDHPQGRERFKAVLKQSLQKKK